MFGFIVFAPYFVCFFNYPFMGNSRETSPYYYWKVTDCLAGYFARIFPNSLHYIWTFTNLFVGALQNFLYLSQLLESFKLFVGVFLKKFRKISHMTGFISLILSFILGNSACPLFSGRFFYHIIAIMRRRVRKSKILPMKYRLIYLILGVG